MEIYESVIVGGSFILNSSNLKDEVMEIFPTPYSPTKTILYESSLSSSAIMFNWII